MASLSYGVLVEREGGVAKLQHAYEVGYANPKLPVEVAESITRVTWFKGNGDGVYLVESHRTFENGQTSANPDVLYVVKQRNGIGRLEILDLGCISVDWIDSMAPGFRGSSIAMDLIARNLLNP
jgi:hypothetical protein